MFDMPTDEIAMNEILRLLAPVLTEGQGMAAREREIRFRNALLDLIDARRN